MVAFFIMNKTSTLLIAILFFASCSDEVASFKTIESFDSQYIASRSIEIYLPPSYHHSGKSFPVLYMHDGQMLFDSTTTWNGQEWGVDETMDRLIEEGAIKESIVVGIWNGGPELRHPEYFPQKPFESLNESVQDSLYNLYRDQGPGIFGGNEVQSDNYLKFIVSELKPYIDSNYKTRSDQANTLVAGSSMGGLISMYAICEYPEVFGGAICMSTHWPGIFTVENNPIPEAFHKYLASNLPDPTNHKLYFDYGTETLDALYEPFQLKADTIIRSNGYTDSNFLTQKFEGDPHDERAWNRRLHIPLKFLLAD